MEHSFQKRMMSLYRTSIFPAAMILTCKKIVKDGPVKVGLGVMDAKQEKSSGMSSQEESDARVFVDASAGAMDTWASTCFDIANSFLCFG